MNKQRIEYIDILKGMLMFLVVWGHAIQYGFGPQYGEAYMCFNDVLYKTIYSFHMPLFMAISGYLFYYSNRKSLKEITISKAKGILVPFFFFCLIYFILFVLKDNREIDLIIFSFLKVLQTEFWFLSSVLLNCIVVAVISHCIPNCNLSNSILIFIVPLILFMPSSILPATHAYMYPCFVFGYLLNASNKASLAVVEKHKWLSVGLSIVLLPLCITLFDKNLFVYKTGVSLIENGYIDWHQLATDLIRWAIGLIASLSVMAIVKSLYESMRGKVIEILIICSKYSIGIYGVATLMQILIYRAMCRFDINMPCNHFYSATYALLVLGVTLCILKYCSKYAIPRLLLLGGR